MKLQVNTAGAWKDVVTFDKAKKPEVMMAVQLLKEATAAKWCIVDDKGRRDWL